MFHLIYFAFYQFGSQCLCACVFVFISFTCHYRRRRRHTLFCLFKCALFSILNSFIYGRRRLPKRTSFESASSHSWPSWSNNQKFKIFTFAVTLIYKHFTKRSAFVRVHFIDVDVKMRQIKKKWNKGRVDTEIQYPIHRNIHVFFHSFQCVRTSHFFLVVHHHIWITCTHPSTVCLSSHISPAITTVSNAAICLCVCFGHSYYDLIAHWICFFS